MTPIYTIDNTTAAFQLNWSVSLFGRIAFPPSSDWLEELRVATEPDGVRILEFRDRKRNVARFLISTRPELSPSQTVRSIKCRWQYLIRAAHPKVFRRNYFIGSVGEANCSVLDRYVAGQTSKHPMADARVQDRLESLQFHDESVDLSRTVTGNYGQFVYGLQVVVKNEGGWNEIRESVLVDSRTMIIRAAAKKQWRLSRIGMLSNHIHILLGVHVIESPAEVAISLMNNLADVQGMKPVFRSTAIMPGRLGLMIVGRFVVERSRSVAAQSCFRRDEPGGEPSLAALAGSCQVVVPLGQAQRKRREFRRQIPECFQARASVPQGILDQPRLAAISSAAQRWGLI